MSYTNNSLDTRFFDLDFKPYEVHVESKNNMNALLLITVLVIVLLLVSVYLKREYEMLERAKLH